MTRPEQPQPYPGDLPSADDGRVQVRQPYRDALGRPITGEVVLTGSVRTGGLVPVPVKVTLTDDGYLDARLPPDTYRLVEALRTADGARFTGSSILVVESPAAP